MPQHFCGIFFCHIVNEIRTFASFIAILMVSTRLRAHAALFFSGVLFGANYWIAKGLMPEYMSPMQIIFYRGLITMLLFQLLSLVIGVEKTSKRDIVRLAVCGLLGVAVNQMFFFTGLNYTSPVDTALIHAGSPLMVMTFSALIIGEKASPLKIIGILLGGTGAVMLVLQGNTDITGSNQLLGNVLVFINIMGYSLYLVLVKPIMARNSPITVLKWVFTFGFFMVFPFSISEAHTVNWSHFSVSAWISIIYIIIGTTFITYLLTTFSLRTLNAGTAGYYIYMQPFIAATIGILFYNEKFTPIKIIAALVVFAGVYLVLKPSIKKDVEKESATIP
jgi:drug/metabolite transporter (DMT)-like permease